MLQSVLAFLAVLFATAVLPANIRAQKPPDSANRVVAQGSWDDAVSRARKAVKQSGGKTASAAIANSRPAPGAASNPADTVRRFLEAQAAGDAGGMLALAALDGMKAADETRLRAAIGNVCSKITLRNLKFDPVAVGTSSGGNYALVRFKYSFVGVGKDGEAPEAGGDIALLARSGDEWKIRHIVPDELLTLETFNSVAAPDAAAAAAFQPAAGRYRIVNAVHYQNAPAAGFARVQAKSQPTPPPGLVNLPEINRAINESINTWRVDEGKLTRDGVYSAFGQIPIVGDTVSNGYTIYERLKTLFVELPTDIREGNLEASMMDVGLLGWGVLQVLAEPFPGLDSMADGVEAVMDQRRYNAVQRYKYIMALKKLKTMDFRAEKKYLFLRSTTRNAPARTGDHIARAAYNDWHGKWPAMGKMFFLSDEFLRRDPRIAFDIGAEWALKKSENETLFLAAKAIGGRTASLKSFDDEVAYLPVRLTHMATRDASSGDKVLRDFQPPGKSPVVIYTLTCNRGKQKVAVELTDGTRTEPVEVENRAYNAITGVRFGIPDGKQADKIRMKVGERLDSVRLASVLAPDPQFKLTPPDLTGLVCADTNLAGSALVDIEANGKWPNASLSIVAKRPGTAMYEVKYDGAIGVPKVNQSIPIEIEGEEPKADFVWVLTEIRRRGLHAKDEPESKGDAVSMTGSDTSYGRNWIGKIKKQGANGRLVEVPYSASVSASWNLPERMIPGQTVTINMSLSTSSSGPEVCSSLNALMPDWKSRKPTPKVTGAAGAFSFSPNLGMENLKAESNGGGQNKSATLVVPESLSIDGASVQFSFSVMVYSCGATSMTDAANLETRRVFEYTCKKAR
jgi:hypothetical protein